MKFLIAVIALVLICVTLPVQAESPLMTRRDGFLLLWNSIHRALDANHEKPFSDVSEGSAGFAEITYAKYRGILDDDDEHFHPADPLMLQDALLWLLRTRSVDDLSRLTPQDLPALLLRYPLGKF